MSQQKRQNRPQGAPQGAQQAAEIGPASTPPSLTETEEQASPANSGDALIEADNPTTAAPETAVKVAAVEGEDEEAPRPGLIALLHLEARRLEKGQRYAAASVMHMIAQRLVEAKAAIPEAEEVALSLEDGDVLIDSLSALVALL